MSLNAMYDENPMTDAQYEQAALDIELANDVPDSAVFFHRLQLDGRASPVLLRIWSKYIELAVTQTMAPIARYNTDYALLYRPGNLSQVTTKRDILIDLQTTIKAKPASWPRLIRQQQFVTFMCLFCRKSLLHQLIATKSTRISIFGWFDITSPRTLDVVTEFCKKYVDYATVYHKVSGICTRCYRPCTECSIELPIPNVTLEELESFYLNKLCIRCNVSNISRLDLPKPTSKDLKLFRHKFIHLHKGG